MRSRHPVIQVEVGEQQRIALLTMVSDLTINAAGVKIQTLIRQLPTPHLSLAEADHQAAMFFQTGAIAIATTPDGELGLMAVREVAVVSLAEVQVEAVQREVHQVAVAEEVVHQAEPAAEINRQT